MEGRCHPMDQRLEELSPTFSYETKSVQADSQVHRLLGWGQKIEAEVCVYFNNATSNFKAKSDSVCVAGGGVALVRC